MAEVKEKSIFELQEEKKKIMKRYKVNEEAVLGKAQHEGLFDYFKRQAKSQANLFLQPTNIKPTPRVFQQTPKQNTDKPRSRRSKSRSLTSIVQISEAAAIPEIEKVKTLILKRQSIIEGTMRRLKKEFQTLQQLKMTTNRNVLNNAIIEMEQAHNDIIQDLESVLLPIFESVRYVDKFAQILETRVEQVRDECQEELKQALSLQKQKEQLKLQLIKEQLTKTAQQKRISQDSETSITQQMRSLSDELNIKSKTLLDFEKENQQLLQTVADLQQVIDHNNQEAMYMRKELDSLTATLQASQLTGLQNQSQSLGDTVKQSSNSHAQFKNRIKKLKIENNKLQQEASSLRLTASKSKSDLMNENMNLYSQVKKLQAKVLSSSRHPNQIHGDFHQQYLSEIDNLQQIISNKENQSVQQKQEWAELYQDLKKNNAVLSHQLLAMSKENEKLLKQLKTSGSSKPETIPTKRKDNEIKALWAVLRDLQRTQLTRGRIDFRDVQNLIVSKNLEAKARKVLK